MLAIGGVGGLAVGLAGREILENLFTGLIILSSSPFEVGDEVLFTPPSGPVRCRPAPLLHCAIMLSVLCIAVAVKHCHPWAFFDASLTGYALYLPACRRVPCSSQLADSVFVSSRTAMMSMGGHLMHFKDVCIWLLPHGCSWLLTKDLLLLGLHIHRSAVAQMVEGIVLDVGWYRTTIRSFEREIYNIPNSVFSRNVVLNITRKNKEWRFYEFIGAPLQAGPEGAHCALCAEAVAYYALVCVLSKHSWCVCAQHSPSYRLLGSVDSLQAASRNWTHANCTTCHSMMACIKNDR